MELNLEVPTIAKATLVRSALMLKHSYHLLLDDQIPVLS
jgi:hypothetical protein